MAPAWAKQRLLSADLSISSPYSIAILERTLNGENIREPRGEARTSPSDVLSILCRFAAGSSKSLSVGITAN